MDSVRSLILQNLQTTIRGLQIAGGYNFDWRNAYTRARLLDDFKTYPSANLTDAGLTYDSSAASCLAREWSVRIDAAQKVIEEDGDDAQTVADQVLEDLEKAVLVDPTRGGNAMDTVPTSATVKTPETSAPFVVVTLIVQIRFRTHWNDPAQQK